MNICQDKKQDISYDENFVISLVPIWRDKMGSVYYKSTLSLSLVMYIYCVFFLT